MPDNTVVYKRNTFGLLWFIWGPPQGIKHYAVADDDQGDEIYNVLWEHPTGNPVQLN